MTSSIIGIWRYLLRIGDELLIQLGIEGLQVQTIEVEKWVTNHVYLQTQ